MIICSVACTESLPIIIQGLFGRSWQPIVVSTIAVALLAELLPQYIIPQQALFWGYYCWPMIWGCMWLTCIISWPLSFILDKIGGSLKNHRVFTTHQLVVLIKFHERVEKHGGGVGSDAGRIARAGKSSTIPSLN
jgi:metal transporter CNNM